MKLTLALILALQVSMCVLADPLPEPDKELVEKYNGLKTIFTKRVVNAYNKIVTAMAPLVENSPTGEKAKEYLEELQKNPRVQSMVKIVGGLAHELEPAVDRVRMAGLGLYGHHLRPYIGEYLDQIINNIKPVLDTVLPQED